ncbi:hypothetical protein [Chitinophaga nivalis]|uniref:Uncharacterized protein n=1 Tax=Chitinophaga nivalis TaxID=2991709 RepID=A0ABT3IGB9_9BACT|nr:hypothetical protein [Chitinophaga nivalis]MCW3467296.1 hypothetical protein [Chitinophaga nivalis]MCW3483012.1 hypothetical protein [Chitinophaga nivalis]
MFTGIFSTSLQRKFCEGFLFHPFKRLRQSGNFIFKQYSPRSGVKTVLEQQRHVYDFNGHFASEIDRKIMDTAIPQLVAVIKRMEALYRESKEEIKACPDLTPEFNDTMLYYYREINIYQSVVLENLHQEMKPVLKKKTADMPGKEPGSPQHFKVQRLIKEFISHSRAVIAYLQTCVDNAYGFPASCDVDALKELISGIRQLTGEQRQLIGLLDKWEDSKRQEGRQIYYN